MSADEAIGSYRAVLVYDAGKLEYVSGGTLLEPGRVEIIGGGGQNSYRTMLAFRTLVRGSSQISVESLELYSDAEGTQPIDILEQASVAVRVPVEEQKSSDGPGGMMESRWRGSRRRENALLLRSPTM